MLVVEKDIKIRLGEIRLKKSFYPIYSNNFGSGGKKSLY